MRTPVVLFTSLVALAALVAPARAQDVVNVSASSTTAAPAEPLFHVQPYVGYMFYGDWLQGPLGTTLSAKNSPVYGAQLSMDIAPDLAVLGNVGYSSSDVRVGIPIIGGVDVGSASVLMYDAGLQYSIPISSTSRYAAIRPFVQAGAGAMHFKVSSGPLNTSSTNFAFNAGAGLAYRVAPHVDVSLMAKDYIGKFDVKQATSLNVQGKTSNNFALTGGVRIGF